MLTATVGSWYNPVSWFVTEEDPVEEEASDPSYFDSIAKAAADAAMAQAAADVAAAADRAAAQAAADVAAAAAADAKAATTVAEAKLAAAAAAAAKAKAEAAAGIRPFYKKPLFWGAVGGGAAILTLGALLMRR